MTRRRYFQIAGGLLLVGLLAFSAARGLERLFRPSGPAARTEAASAPAADVPHITATLFYGTEDGQALTGIRREVPLADGVIAQGRQILALQMEAAPAPYLPVIPHETALRAFYVTPNGDAFVDLSQAVTTGHPGGSTAELLTVYAIVNAVVANLPTIQRVQILVEGKEVDTLAGHVDLRRPLQRDVTLLRDARPNAGFALQ